MDNATMDILGLLEPQDSGIGLKVVKILTTEPDEITLAFEGSDLALDLDIFEVPVALYPLLKDDRLLALPIAGEGYSQRWALLGKLTGGVVMGTMVGPTSLQLDGSEMTYTADRLVLPQYLAVANTASTFTDTNGKTSASYLQAADIRLLQAGDRVSVQPTLDGEVIKYVVAAKY